MPTLGADLWLRVIALAFSPLRLAGTPGIGVDGPIRSPGCTRRDGIDGRTKSTPLRRPAFPSFSGRGSLCISNLLAGEGGASVSPRNSHKANLNTVLFVDDRIVRAGTNFKKACV